MPPDWLISILRGTPEPNNCMRLGCPVCGERPFVVDVDRLARTEIAKHSKVTSSDILVSDEWVVRTVIATIHRLPPNLRYAEPAELLLREFAQMAESIGLDISDPLTLDRPPSKDERAKWVETHARLEKEWAQEAEVRAKADEAREVARLNAIQHKTSVRATEKRGRDEARDALLAELKALSPQELLHRLATDLTLDLNAVPAELISAETIRSEQLSPAVAKTLLERIGNRAGAWKRVTSLLRSRLRR